MTDHISGKITLDISGLREAAKQSKQLLDQIADSFEAAAGGVDASGKRISDATKVLVESIRATGRQSVAEVQANARKEVAAIQAAQKEKEAARKQELTREKQQLDQIIKLSNIEINEFRAKAKAEKEMLAQRAEIRRRDMESARKVEAMEQAQRRQEAKFLQEREAHLNRLISKNREMQAQLAKSAGPSASASGLGFVRSDDVEGDIKRIQRMNDALEQQVHVVKRIAAANAESAREAKAADSLKATLSRTEQLEREAMRLGVGFTPAQLDMSRGTAEADRALRQYNQGLSDNITLQKEAISRSQEFEGNLIRTRYALFDMANSLAIASAALLAFVGLGVKAGADYEQAFTFVARATEAPAPVLKNLRREFQELGLVIPKTFEELSEIGGFGAQLGIADEMLTRFTATTAKFSEITGVTEEESAKNFGRLVNLLGLSMNQLEAFADSLAKSGVDAAATEQEILALTSQLAPFTRQAGMSAEYAIGLSTALASLRVPPELARSGIQYLFRGLDRAIVDGGSKLQAFADLLGVTADEARRLWSQDSEQFFDQFARKLNEAFLAGENMTKILDSIGINEKRADTVLKRIAQNYDLVAESIGIARESWGSGFLDEASEHVFTTLTSKVQMFGNAVRNLMADSMGPLNEVLKNVVDTGTELIQWFSSLPSWITSSLAVVVALTGGLGALLAMLGLTVASLLAMRTSMQEMAKITGVSGNVMSQAWRLAMMLIRGETDATRRSVDALNASMARGSGASKRGFLGSGTSRLLAGGGLFAIGATMGFILEDNLAKSIESGIERGVRSGGDMALGTLSKLFTGAAFGSLFGPIGAAVGAGIGAIAGGIGELTAYNKELLQSELTVSRIKELMPILESGSAGVEEAVMLREELTRTMTLLNSIDKGAFKDTLAAGDLGQVWGITSATDFIGEFRNSIKEIEKAVENGSLSLKTFSALYGELMTAARNIPGVTDSATFTELESKLNGIRDSFVDIAWSQGELKEGSTDAFSALAASADDANESLEAVSVTLTDIVTEIFDVVNAEAGLASALSSLGSGLAQSKSFDMFTAEGRANIEAYQGALESLVNVIQSSYKNGLIDSQQALAEWESGLAEINKLVGDSLPQELRDLANNVLPELEAAFADAEFDLAVDNIEARVNMESLESDIATIEALLIAAGKDFSDLATFTSTALFDSNPADRQIAQFIDRVSRNLGVPFEAVVDALTKPGADKIQTLLDSVSKALSKPAVVTVDADTRAAAAKINAIASAVKSIFPQSFGSVIDKGAAFARRLVGSAPTANAHFDYGRIAGSSVTGSGSSGAYDSGRNLAKSYFDGYNNELDKMSKNSKKAADKAGKEAERLKREQERLAKEAKRAAEEYRKSQEEAFEAAAEYIENYHVRVREALTRAQYATYASSNALDGYFGSVNSIASRINDNIDRVRSLSSAMRDQRDSIQEVIDKQRELRADAAKDRAEARKAEIERDIAIRYGDTDRVNQYTAEYDKHMAAAIKKENEAARAENELAKIRKEIEEAQREITKLMSERYSLTGFSEAAIANRKAVQDLQTELINMIATYAESGKTQAQVGAYADSLKVKFEAQMKSLGFAAEDVKRYAEEFNRVADNAKKVPREIDVKTNRTPVEELNYQLRGTKRLIEEINGMKVTVNTQEVNVPYGSPGAPAAARGAGSTAKTTTSAGSASSYEVHSLKKGEDFADIAKRAGMSTQELMAANPQINFGSKGALGVGVQVIIPKKKKKAEGGVIPGVSPTDPTVDNVLGFNEQGQLTALVRSNEFVLRQRAHEYYGTHLLEDLNKLRIPKNLMYQGRNTPRFASGGSTGAYYANTLNSLNPADLRELAAVMERAVARGASEGISNTPIIINDDTIARSNAKGTANLRRKGELP